MAKRYIFGILLAVLLAGNAFASIPSQSTFPSTPSGGGTINSGTAKNVGYYAASGTTISSSSALQISSTGITASLPFATSLTVATGANTNAIIAQNSSATSYNAITFNGTLTDAGLIGMSAGATGVNNLYLNVPSTGLFWFNVNGTTHPIIQISSSGLIIVNATTPADNAVCTAGTIYWDTGFIYVCTASGTVKRAALSTY